MAWDLVGELRQLSHDVVNTSPQAEAIKAKHPAILDAAAREIVVLRERVDQLQADIDKMMPLVEAVGACQKEDVPESVYQAWSQPSQYQRTCAECGSSR
jgi:hypothetical protein